MDDDELSRHLENLHRSAVDHANELRFLLALNEKTLLILIRLAYIMERVSNKTFDLEEAPDEPSTDRIESMFAEIRELFDQQSDIMKSGTETDE